jgi:hypothetical protein
MSTYSQVKYMMVSHLGAELLNFKGVNTELIRKVAGQVCLVVEKLTKSIYGQVK